MSISDPHIDYDLIAKYLAGELDESDRKQFEEAMNASESLAKEVDNLTSIWEAASEEAETTNINTDAAWSKVSGQVSETVASGTVRHTTDEPEVRPKVNILWLSIAASVVIIFTLTTLHWYFNQEAMQLLSTEDHLAAATLPDGSEVSLNERSSLKYPEVFSGAFREVWLDGEGYFEVTSNSAQPFIVHTDVGDVRVVGTAFEVSTFGSTTALKVEVNEGIVKVYKQNTYLNKEVRAGETCLLNASKETIEVKPLADPAAFFWHDKTIKFKRTELKMVVETLQKTLGIEVKLSSDQIAGCELTATFKNESADTILEIIATTLGLTLEKENDSYTLTGNGC